LRWEVVGAVVVACSVACVEPEPNRGGGPELAFGVEELIIDAGRELDLEPGSGVGVGVQYAGDGEWALFTVCESGPGSELCIFDVLVSSDERISSFVGVELEANDLLFAPNDFAVQMDFVTSDAQDAIEFETTPGATVRVSALLYDPVLDSSIDWSDDPRMISWVGSGAAHSGAPTNPVDLTPDRP
jgi:hypothetical protein